MANAALRESSDYYTYGDYKTWDDDLRYELIDGEAFLMSPAPTTTHQGLLGNLFWQINGYFRNIGGECQVFFAPVDVLLPDGDEESEDDIDTVVQPDIVIVCDKSKVQVKGIFGAPDVVFEVLSPSTKSRDMDEKLRLYERAGVREYFIVDPKESVVTAYRSKGGDHFSRKTLYEAADTLEFDTFKELKVSLAEVFA
ncbi:hypothetical protein AGMMS49957_08130 [Synergistales bacterium]|nr:hypothetical protein AGMMS49957_08130 [Synergistales bacterium]